MSLTSHSRVVSWVPIYSFVLLKNRHRVLVLVRRSCEKLNRDEYCTCSGNTLSLQGVEWRIHGGQECCQKGKFSEQGSIETVTAIVVNKFKRVPFRSSREQASQDSVSCQTSHVPSPSIDRWADIFLLVRNTTGMEGQSGKSVSWQCRLPWRNRKQSSLASGILFTDQIGFTWRKAR